MELEFTWINLLILFGAFHGLIFGVILVFNKKHPGTKFLAIFMFILSYNGLETFSWASGLDAYTMIFDLVSFVLIFGIGPSLYLYLRALLMPNDKLSAGIILSCYSPLILQLVVKSVIVGFYIYASSPDISEQQVAMAENLLILYGAYSEPLSIVIFLFYLIMSIQLFFRFNKRSGSTLIPKSDKETIYRWVKAFLICMILLAIVWPITLISSVFFEIDGDAHYYPIEILLVLFIYWIAFVGYQKIKSIDALKSRTNDLPSSEAKKYLDELSSLMKRDRLFLDPELSRDKVASRLGISAKLVSAVLNQYAEKNFNDFVNAYRVEEATKKLLSGEYEHLTLSAIGLDAGFNSQATFQRAFKNTHGLSPKEYLSKFSS